MNGSFENETPYVARRVVECKFTPYGYLPPLFLIEFNGIEIAALRKELSDVQMMVDLANDAFNKGRQVQIDRSRNFVVVSKDDNFVFGNDQFNN